MAARRWIGLGAVLGAVVAIAALIALRSGAPVAGRSMADGGPGARAAATPPAGELPRGDASGGAGRAPEPRRVPPEDRIRAASLVVSARAELAAGRLARGREQLVDAYAFDPQPATLLELGRVDLQAGRCRDARRAVQGVLAAAPAPPLVDEARALLAEIGRCD